MLNKNSFKVAIFGIAAFFCMSGQIARKEIHEAPSTQVSASNEMEMQEEERSEKSEENKSAAKRAMEESGYTTLNRKSAAKRAMELKD